MKLSISIEGANGLNWSRWKSLIAEIERLGFSGCYGADHFSSGEYDTLDVFTALTYLACHSQRVHMGTLVSPLSFRDPVMLARQAMAIDDLSGGRMILGVGAGWDEPEHTMFGYDLGDMNTRFERLGEGLEVITRLIRSDEPVTFEGRFFQLHEARLLPRSQRQTPVLIGGKGVHHTLPLVARYADIWNGVSLPPAAFAERSALLTDLLRSVGRRAGDVKRTHALLALCWRDTAERDSLLNHIRQIMPFLALPTDEMLNMLSTVFFAVVGTPDQVIEQFRAYQSAGVEELMIQYVLLDNLTSLYRIAEDVLPQFN